MPEISLTEFFEYLSAAGMKKAAVVRKIKNKNVYDPKEDYYKGFRDSVQSFHKGDRGDDLRAHFKSFLTNEVHSKKKVLYGKMCDGYRKLLDNAAGLKWSPSKKYKWTHGELTVKLSPIWSYNLEADLLVTKPHLNKTSLARAQDKVALVLVLMRESVPMRSDARVAVMDVGASRAYSDEPTDPIVSRLLKAEAVTFMALYDAA